MVTVVMRISVTACAVWKQLIAGCWVIGRRCLGWSGCRVDCVIRYTLSMCGQCRRRSTAADCRLGTETVHYCAANGDRPESLCGTRSSGVHAKGAGVDWVTGDALEYRPKKPVDIVVSSLLAHHLEDEEIVTLLRWMEATVQIGWFINDLERSEWSSRIFGWERWHWLVRHDGPVSFRRAFRKEDWVRFLAAAEVPQEAVTVEQWRPGRLCVGGGSDVGDS